MIVLTLFSDLFDALRRLTSDLNHHAIPTTVTASAALWMAMDDGASGV